MRGFLKTAFYGILVLCVGLVACDETKLAPGDKGGVQKAPVKKGGGDFVPGDPDKGSEKDAAAKAEFKGSGEFMPRPDALKKYSLSHGPDYYTKDTLFEIIDGGSAAYLDYGIEEMVKAVYKSKEGEYKDEINVEIYKFGQSVSAFGKFGRERSECAKRAELIENWCVRSSDLIFWKGAYLIKVQAFDDTKAAEAATLEMAKKVDGAIKDKAELPAMFTRFPAEQRVKGAGGYSPVDPYGLGGLKNIYLMGFRPEGDAYKAADDYVTLFASEFAAEDAAKKQIEAIKVTLDKQAGIKAKGGVKALAGVEGGYIYQDTYGTHTIVVKGKVVAGGRDFKDEETAKKMMTALVGTL